MREKIPDFNDTELWVIRRAVTGHNEYTDLGKCVATLLQVQADHADKRAAEPNG